jgi:hypothetical protein
MTTAERLAADHRALVESGFIADEGERGPRRGDCAPERV